MAKTSSVIKNQKRMRRSERRSTIRDALRRIIKKTVGELC